MTEFVAEANAESDAATTSGAEVEVEGIQEQPLDFKTGRALKPSDLLILLMNPKAFFGAEIALLSTKYVYPLMVILGMQGVMNRIDKGLLQSGAVDQSTNFYMWMGNNGWPIYWGSVLLIGALSGIVVWTIRGWWYNVRLSWCGVKDFDKENGRAIFAYNASLPALATVLLGVSQIFIYPDYLTAFNADGTGGLEKFSFVIILALTALSYVNSYRSVTGVFKARKGMAMVLFLVLPVSLVLAGVLMFILA